MDVKQLLDAINYRGVVSGLTHDFYRYPARFSPLFARKAIDLFTKPGDVVLDPFVGGGTSLVEALASGRSSVGTDISQLAVFLAQTKTTLLKKKEIDAVVMWSREAASQLSPLKPVERDSKWHDAGYQDNLPWRFRKIAEQALGTITELPSRVRPVGRCILLRTVQWAVDCRMALPSISQFREHLTEYALSTSSGLEELKQRVASISSSPPSVEVFNASANDIGRAPSLILKKKRAKLVVTSPPYPGIHVVYHRWQVHGRRETPAPFWIAECHDGQGGAFYTFGDRRRHDHDEQYFVRLQQSFTEIRKVVRDDGIVVQLVGFSRPDKQLPRYLQAMKSAGFEEFTIDRTVHSIGQKDFWRAVPHRKWYTSLRDETENSSEILLIHRAS